MGGALEAAVIADDCFWEITDGVLVLTLVKQLRAKACGREDPVGWWGRVLASDKLLDVTLCDKEPFMLGEMDDLKHNSMRYHVAKMLGMDDASPIDGS